MNEEKRQEELTGGSASSSDSSTSQMIGGGEGQQEPLVEQLERLVAITKTLVQEVEGLQRWHPLAGSVPRVLLRSFLRGVSWGLGQTVGAAVVLTLLVWLVGRLQLVPGLGVWIARLIQAIQEAQQGF